MTDKELLCMNSELWDGKLSQEIPAALQAIRKGLGRTKSMQVSRSTWLLKTLIEEGAPITFTSEGNGASRWRITGDLARWWLLGGDGKQRETLAKMSPANLEPWPAY